MPFILNEDKALKTILSGITVADSGNATRPVGVFYGQPDKEIRAQAYPYITIDLISVTEDTSRAHRGYLDDIPYIPEGADPDIDIAVDYPIPVDLVYQITTWARQPRHDRQIMSALYTNGRLPLRFGSLPIEEDGTIRRLDMLGFQKNDRTENDKRLFSNAYTIRVSAEIFQSEFVQLYQVEESPTITFTSQDTPFTQIIV